MNSLHSHPFPFHFKSFFNFLAAISDGLSQKYGSARNNSHSQSFFIQTTYYVYVSYLIIRIAID